MAHYYIILVEGRTIPRNVLIKESALNEVVQYFSMCIFLLFQSYCCKGELDGRKAGGCNIHARKCGADLGLFIKLSSCQLVILSGVSRGGSFPAPYVDRFGEHDIDLQRGNPLKLDKVQYQKLNKMWQQNDLQTYIIAKAQRAIRHPLDLQLQWYLI